MLWEKSRSGITGRWEFVGQISDWVYFPVRNSWAAYHIPFPGTSCPIYVAQGLTLCRVGMKPPNSARRSWDRTCAWGGRACGGRQLFAAEGDVRLPLYSPGLNPPDRVEPGGGRREKGRPEWVPGRGQPSSAILPQLHRTFPTRSPPCCPWCPCSDASVAPFVLLPGSGFPTAASGPVPMHPLPAAGSGLPSLG